MFYVKKIFTVALLLIAGSLSAQPKTPSVEARFSADSVLIGDQFRLDIEVDKDVMEVVEFPVFDRGHLGGDSTDIEILAEGPVDTLKTDGRRITLKKSYLLTCFEEADYRIGKFPVLYINKNIIDTLWSMDSLRIFVNTLSVDTATQTIHDVKLPLEVPVRFGEYGGYLLTGLLGAALIALVVFLLVKRFRGKRQSGGKRVPAEPPHVTAIRQLEKLHSQKLWQSGKQKAYYTGITDILREYLSTRYPVKALEMTSQEILDRMIREEIDQAAQRHPDHRRFRKIRQIHTGCGSERNGLHGRLLFHRRDQSGRGGTARRRDRTDQNRGKEGGRRMIRHTIITCLLLLAAGTAAGQKYPERRDIRSGNKFYGKAEYSEAEISYRKALEKQPDSYEANFNLADALYKQKRYDEAAGLNEQLAADSARLDNAASAYFNQGNALFQQRKLQEALEAYKNSLRLNPADMEAKFNYAYTKKLLDKDKNDQNKNDQNKDQNKDNRNDQNKNDKNDPNQNPDKDRNKDNPDNNQNGNDPDKQDQQPPSGGQQPPQGGMSREEAERMLDAVQGSEDKTKKKVDEKKAVTVGNSGKNW